MTENPRLHQYQSFHIEGEEYRGILFRSSADPLFAEQAHTSIFETKKYHQALEAAPPEKMQFWYIRLERDGKAVGQLTFQVKDFNPGVSLQKHARKNIFHWLRYTFASLINLKVLCLGNTLVTGDYGFCFPPTLPLRVQTLLMMHSIEWMLTLPAFKGVRLIFIKDFYQDIFNGLTDNFMCQRYHPIDTQPSMIMNIDPAWHSFDDYILALKSKYRVRAKKALETASPLTRLEINADEIEAVEEQLHALYLKVVEDVGFNLFILPPNYFSTLKRTLGDSFRLWIYKDGEELISFFTVFEDGHILDAHFLGYDPEINHRWKLYMNMLLAMIREATEKRFSQLQLSRTATEIKSSVGAQGIPMWAYLRLRHPFFNSLLPLVYNFFKPDLSWTPRDPFSHPVQHPAIPVKD